jgi:predicted CoA-binding protein
MMNADDKSIRRILSEARTIAILGLSSRPERPSFDVAAYLQQHGYRIIPVNPTYAGTDILGEHCYSTLKQAAATLSDEGLPLDIVACFRRPEALAQAAEQAIAARFSCLWLQAGLSHPEAETAARDAGIQVVVNRCLRQEHLRLMRSEVSPPPDSK